MGAHNIPSIVNQPLTLHPMLYRRQFRITTFDEQSGLDPAPFADLFGESDDLFDVSSATGTAKACMSLNLCYHLHCMHSACCHGACCHAQPVTMMNVKDGLMLMRCWFATGRPARLPAAE